MAVITVVLTTVKFVNKNVWWSSKQLTNIKWCN